MKHREFTRRDLLQASLGVVAGAAAGSWTLSYESAQAEEWQLARIFVPTTISSMKLKNRLVRSSTWEGMADAEGLVTDRLLDLYRRLARGGIGLIHTGALYVCRDGKGLPFQTGVDRDECIPGLARLAEVVHEKGGRIVGQIFHAGGQADRKDNGGRPPVAPSAGLYPGYGEEARALTEREVGEIISAFAAAAGRVKSAGCDGVQIHAAHGYLVSQFLSPSRNRRADRYGGSTENRAHFALEVYKAIRAEVGPSYPALIKLNAHDRLEDSSTEIDAVYLASALAKAGIDAIEVSSGTGADGGLSIVRPKILTRKDEAYNLPAARRVRAAVPEVPLMLVGGLRSLETIEGILQSREADYFSMARPLIRQPDLPARWARGDRARSSCISCNGCLESASKGEGIRCVQLRA
jgi:2,4-dienoyl-CoA reductase-like NADH-dependent reductase (Old Yellow Enzyme family)